MDAEQYQLEFELFQRCLGLDRVKQEEVLAEACEGDRELRQRIEALLAGASASANDLVSDRQIDARESSRWLGKLADALHETEPETPETPETIGPFRIVRLIGEGGMGRVYEAEQLNPRRRVALKLVSPHARSSGLMQRFELETDVLARLQHPGIAPIFECGEHEGEAGPQPYFAMEYVDGVDVRTHAERAQLGVDAKLALVAEIADAIEHAHTKGVIHRDLKPDNVLVDESGRPKVLDFGIARVTDDSTLMRTAVTETGQLIGTLNYMAPEQLTGDSTQIDARTDVYALGVLLFELLSGRRPHEVAGLTLTAAIRVVAEEEAPRLGRCVPGIPRDVETIAGKALEKLPERRYATAGALAADLRRFLAHRPITARPPSAIYLARRFTQRHRGLVTGSALALLAIALGFGGVIASQQREALAREKAEVMGIDALASSYLATHATLDRGDPWAARDQLDRIQPENRGWEWRWLDARAPLVLEGLHPKFLAFQGPLIGAIAETGERRVINPLVVVDLERPEERRIVPGLDGAFGPTSAGASSVLVQTRTPAEPGKTGTGYHAVTAIVDLPTREVTEFIVHAEQAELDLSNHVVPQSMTADGLLAEVYIGWDASGNQRSSVRLTTRAERAAGLPGRRSGEYVGWVYSGLIGAGELCMLQNSVKNLCRIVSTADWSDVAVLDADVNIACALDGTGQRVARLRSGLLEVLAFPSLDVLKSFSMPEGDVRILRWIRDDEWFLVHVGPQPVILDAEDGSLVETLDTGSFGGVSGLSGDGRYLSLLAGRRNLSWVHELGAPPPSAYRELRGHTEWIYQVAYSPDGALIASAAPEDPHLRLWDGWTGEPLALLPRPVGPPRKYLNYEAPLAFTDDGRTLVTTAPVENGVAVVTYDLCTGASRTLEAKNWIGRHGDLRAVLGDLAGRRLSGGLVGHPDGRQLFHSEPKRDVEAPFSLERTDSEESQDLGTAQGIGLSPNGEWLAIGGVGGFSLMDTDDLEVSAEYSLGGNLARYYAVAWSPDGQRLALGEDQGQVTILETQHFRPIVHLPTHDHYVYSIVWSPDGTRLVTASGDATLRIHDTLHGIPSRLRAERRARQVEEQRAKLEAWVAKLGSVPAAVQELLTAVAGDAEATTAAQRACLLRSPYGIAHRATLR